MSIEIERKFLVSGDSYKSVATVGRRIRQGYICRGGGRTVRVRQRDDKAFLTIKGPSADGGLSRYEFETEIAPEDAAELFKLCEPGIVDKTRWIVGRWEIDEFHGPLAPLVLAEIELAAPDEPFDLPPFIGEEVTGQKQYYNTFLAALAAAKEA